MQVHWNTNPIYDQWSAQYLETRLSTCTHILNIIIIIICCAEKSIMYYFILTNNNLPSRRLRCFNKKYFNKSGIY